MKKWLKRMILILLGLLIVIGVGSYLYLQHPKFGQLPTGTRLSAISQSSHYKQDQFQNLQPITIVANSGSSFASGIGFLFRDSNITKPPVPIPTVKTDLHSLDRQSNVIVWLGHSSYFIQLDGKTILIDPVLSQDAAPLPFVNRSFDGTNLYRVDELPDIDYLLISHDHWDHLDYPTISELKNRVKHVVMGLGVGQHFERWQYNEDKITELDWFEQTGTEELTIHFLPAQHFSGRLFDRNKTLWGAFAIITPQHRLFFSGDSGYSPHFSDIGEQFVHFDLVMLDSGQYDDNWPSVHMNPEQAAQAAEDLHAEAFLPGHIGKFSIAYHSWDDPFKRLYTASRERNYRLLSPMIGEPLYLDDKQQLFEPWWETLESH